MSNFNPDDKEAKNKPPSFEKQDVSSPKSKESSNKDSEKEEERNEEGRALIPSPSSSEIQASPKSEDEEPVNMDELMSQLFASDDDQIERKVKERRNRNRVRQILREKNLKYLRDEDNDIVMIFGKTESRNFDVMIYITFTGDVISSVGLPDFEFEEFDRDRALEYCNDWHIHRRWPTAMVKKEQNKFMLNTHLDTEHVKSKTFLGDYIAHQMIGATMHFCDELATEW